MYLDLCGRSVPLHELGSSSFAGLLSSYAPQLLPGASWRSLPGPNGPNGANSANGPNGANSANGANAAADALPHATTIVAAVCDGGVVLASDRRATAGNLISKRDVEKVFRCDEFSAVGIAGVLALGLEFVKLFQVEAEHYEKMEGRSLSLEGKANRLAAMIRGNLGLAMQGLVLVPLFAGYDTDSGAGRIFSYDPAGGPSEERRFYSVGSGSVFAMGALKKLYTENMPADEAVLCCLQALYDAADDDSATGGPDLPRSIFPVVTTVTGDGFRRLPEAEVTQVAQRVVAGRMSSPDGPLAALHD
jgi:proteasome beta subunit